MGIVKLNQREQGTADLGTGSSDAARSWGFPPLALCIKTGVGKREKGTKIIAIILGLLV
ncbi:hypothetical protein [Moorena bouillonii]|uniref:hypothetical protein n=1 Tax=Moorena bouillonii TaxID=207920 RepID=UPI00130178DE|nr:hypothetical protein [Moorena bouillonii]